MAHDDVMELLNGQRSLFGDIAAPIDLDAYQQFTTRTDRTPQQERAMRRPTTRRRS